MKCLLSTVLSVRINALFDPLMSESNIREMRFRAVLKKEPNSLALS